MQESMDVMISDFSACEAFFKDVIETYGRLDILVNIDRDHARRTAHENDGIRL